MFTNLGKLLIVFGAIFIVVGALLVALGKLSGIGKLPGDILIQKKNFTFYFQIVTSLLLSLILTILLNLWLRQR